MDDLQHRALVAQLAGPAIHVEVLRELHRDNGHGLCAGCLAPGYGVPYLPWPCLLRRLADEAAHMHVTRKFAAPVAA